jgi:hypothetical protein
MTRPCASLLPAILASALVATSLPEIAGAQPDDKAGDEAGDRAGERPSGDIEIKETARQLYDEAKEARQKEEWAVCHAKAAAAWAIHRHPRIGALLGDCAIAIGRYAEGAEPLAAFLATPDAAAISQELKTHLQSRFDEAKKHIAIVKLTASEPGAAAKVDGTLIPRLPATLYLDPGQRTFDASHPDCEAAHEARVLGAGTEIALELELPRRKRAPVVPAPDPRDHDEDDGRIPIAFPIVTGVLAAGGIGLGIASVVLMSGANGDIDDLSANLGDSDSACISPSAATAGDCSSLKTAAEDSDLFQTLTIVGFATGGAFAAATIGMLVYNATLPSPGEGGDEVTLTITPTLGGLLVNGRF